MPDGGLRLYLAPSDPTLAPSPTWTLISSGLVASVDIRRGRQDEFNKTSTGTATVHVNERAGYFDPTSPSYGNFDGKQARIDLYDPVAAAWRTIFRGFVDDGNSDVDPSQIVTRDALQLVDGFDYLARAEASPGIAGDTVPSGNEGQVFYEDGNVDDRIIQVLADALWPSALSVVFSGNVTVQETVYDPQASFLSILADAADAEFPDVANIYVDRSGRFVFHGRFARFDPDATAAGAAPGAWDFNRWDCGDGAAIASDADKVQIRALSYARPMSFVYNAALCYPQYPMAGTGAVSFVDADIPAQVKLDTTSRDAYGNRPWSATGLLTLLGTTSGLTGPQETATFAQYIVDNFANPRTRISSIGFRSHHLGGANSATTWALLTKVDVSDIVQLTTTHQGGGGFSGDEFFVEGVNYTIVPGNADFADVTLSLDVSPQSYYNTPF